MLQMASQVRVALSANGNIVKGNVCFKVLNVFSRFIPSST